MAIARAFRLPYLMLACLVTACSVAASTAAEIPPGRWAGTDGQADVDASGAVFTFHCAAGTAAAPLTLDAEGRFDLAGRFERRAGPEPYRQLAARYRGRVAGDTLTLEVRLEDDTIAAGPMQLKLGAPPARLQSCR
jgi:hypothetical protein